jgi:hydrogenase/urease accessory protein HupE
MSTYGPPSKSAFKGLFWLGWLGGIVEVSVVVGLIAVFHGYSFGRLAEHGKAVLLYGISWAVISVVVGLSLPLRRLVKCPIPRSARYVEPLSA